MTPINLFYEINRAGEKHNVTFAQLTTFPSGTYIRLRGEHIGRFAGIGRKGEEAPYLEGELVFEGPVSANGERLTQVVGGIWSVDDAHGTPAYQGVIHCSCWPLAMMLRRSEDYMMSYGICLRVKE